MRKKEFIVADACILLLLATAVVVSGCGRYGSQASSRNASLAGVEPTFSSISNIVFQSRCTSCHSGPNPSTGLDLTSHASLLSHGDVKPFNPDGSLLIGKLRSGSMPQGGTPLPGDVIDTIAQWIQDGARNN